MTMPRGWYSVPRVGEWEEGVSPARGVAGFDTFQDPRAAQWIVVGRRSVQTGVSLDQWVRQLTETRTLSYPASTCVPPERRSAAPLAGEEARVLTFHCPVDGPLAVAAQVLAIHRDFGFVAMCFDEDRPDGPLPEFEQACLDLLDGFAFA